VTTERPADVVSLGLYALGMAAAIAAIVHWPFLFTPIGVLSVMVGLVVSGSNRRVAGAAVLVLVLGFMIGASLAIWDSNPLY
jgi:hypothetical protein